MNIDLPEKAAKLLRKIRRNYKVDFEPLVMGDIKLQLLQVQDLENILQGRDPFANISDFPFWIKLWEAAIILAEVTASLEPAAAGPRLLELGAGIGAPGLVAAARGFDVTLTDYEQVIMNFQQVSAAASGLKPKFALLDWTKSTDMAPFDTIIGAEILFRQDLLEPLLRIFKKLLKPGGKIYLAHDLRRQTLYKFLDKAKDDYKIMSKKIDLTSAEGRTTVMLNCLQAK
ncbi:MAG: methyltransferase domain-containing protein [Deltaproteobacteria bacterium]|nr:methyltransferase domain-containing protein [Deltaproteobacteria bacterium]